MEAELQERRHLRCKKCELPIAAFEPMAMIVANVKQLKHEMLQT